MKMKFIVVGMVGISVCGGVAWAQPATPSAPQSPPAAVQVVPPKAAVTDATPTQVPVDLGAKPPGEKPTEGTSLRFEGELPSAIQFLARLAELNIHFDPGLAFTNAVPTADGKPSMPLVSLRWDNVTPQDALNEVLDNHGLILVPNPKTGVARVTRRPVIAPLVTSIIQLKYSNPTNIADLIKSTFIDPRCKVSPDGRTGQLVLVTTEHELGGITNLVVQLDMPIRQVLIEAKLLETSKNPKTVKGIDWSGTLQGQNVTFGNGRTTGATTTQTPGQSTTTTLPSGRALTATAEMTAKTDLSTQLGAGGFSFDTLRGFYPGTAFLNADGVRAVLSFLNTDADTEVVATPRQVTSDNQTATLAVTRAFPIFEITPGAANTPPTAKITYTNLGTILKVTPHITASDKVNLKVIPEVSNIDSKDRQIINGDINEANVYAIRRMETDVVIPSGNTLVMGGLISDTTSKSYTKVPILGDIPGIGMAFRHDTKERRKSNLIIFITPTIVQDSDFQPTQTDFLRTPPKDKADVEESAWDRGKPKEWKKSRK